MIDLQSYLEEKVCDIISKWIEDDIYAVSFFVYSSEYNCALNVPEFSVGYNTERDCVGAGALSEERWNYAFWRQNEVPIIENNVENKGLNLLLAWYKENGIDNVGYEDLDNAYNEKQEYIGKGPNGFCELLFEIVEVAKKLHESGFIKDKFGKAIPIIIHHFEYPWYIIEANKKANPNGEADLFLKAMEEMGIV